MVRHELLTGLDGVRVKIAEVSLDACTAASVPHQHNPANKQSFQDTNFTTTKSFSVQGTLFRSFKTFFYLRESHDMRKCRHTESHTPGCGCAVCFAPDIFLTSAQMVQLPSSGPTQKSGTQRNPERPALFAHRNRSEFFASNIKLTSIGQETETNLAK